MKLQTSIMVITLHLHTPHSLHKQQKLVKVTLLIPRLLNLLNSQKSHLQEKVRVQPKCDFTIFTILLNSVNQTPI